MAKKSKYTYYPQAVVKDELDGSVYTLGMTIESFSVEISGNSHPFYTGKETLVDTAGRIDKFKTRLAAKNNEVKEKKAKVRKQKMSFEDLMGAQKVAEAPVKKEKKPAKQAVAAQAVTEDAAPIDPAEATTAE
jgi:large subunit ribosomal protein L31